MQNPTSLVRSWLILGISSLALAGMFSIVLVLLRTPGVEALIPYHDFFRTALIVHVNLSVLLWMLSSGGMLWALLTAPAYQAVAKTGCITTAAGMVLMALSPFLTEGRPLMNNYVPMLQNLPFSISLALIASGVLLQVGVTLLSVRELQKAWREKDVIGLGSYSAALITATAFSAFVLSGIQVKRMMAESPMDIQHFYELLFWGGGHVLQYAYTQLMCVAWVLVLLKAGVNMPLFIRRALLAGWGVNVLLSVVTPFFYAFYEVSSTEYMAFFTEHMRQGGGITAIITGVCVIWALLKHKSASSPQKAALWCSLFLFGAGGVLGHMISGVNVTIPAHYHGAIVGITLAFMALVYELLPTVGYSKVTGKMAMLQPVIYTAGQFMHIAGLAWSGGYGALRKTPGAMLSVEAKAGMALMGMGGLIAIIGGLLFVIVTLSALTKGKK